MKAFHSLKTGAALALLLAVTGCQPDPAVVQPSKSREPLPAATPAAGAATAPISVDADHTYVFDENALAAAGWTRSFNEDFSGSLAQWNVWTGGAYNNELQYYQPANLSVADGNLVITARKETVTGAATPYDQTPKTFVYTSGRIESKVLVSANTATPRVRMAARIRLPQGYGMWPAFWSYGDPWPTQGEIDVLEARGQEPYQYQTNYFYGRSRDRNLARNGAGFFTADEDLQAGYHVYEMIWAQHTLTAYLDGKPVETKSGGYIPNLFGKREKLALNLAVGGNFFAGLDPARITPGTMYVDWVKVFTAK
jgi:beta-glucanase (GH16 family)